MFFFNKHLSNFRRFVGCSLIVYYSLFCIRLPGEGLGNTLGTKTTSLRKSTQVRWIAKGSLTGSECESVSGSSESCARMTATMGLSFVTERCVFKKTLDKERFFVCIPSQTRAPGTHVKKSCVPDRYPRAPTLFFELHQKCPLSYNGALVRVL